MSIISNPENNSLRCVLLSLPYIIDKENEVQSPQDTLERPEESRSAGNNLSSLLFIN